MGRDVNLPGNAYKDLDTSSNREAFPGTASQTSPQYLQAVTSAVCCPFLLDSWLAMGQLMYQLYPNYQPELMLAVAYGAQAVLHMQKVDFALLYLS